MLTDGTRPDQETFAEMVAWMEDGGAKVMEDFKALDADMREGVIEYLEDMSLYEELEVGKEKYILVHAGIADYDPKLPLENYMPEDFINEPIDVNYELIDGVTIIAGHVPTYMIDGADKGQIYYGEGSIIIDCGAAFGEPLACLCLENGKEYYIND
jgi:serine/threonine protein phosphatase 1